MPRARFDPQAEYEVARPLRLSGVDLKAGDALPASVPGLPGKRWDRRRESLYRMHSIRLRETQLTAQPEPPLGNLSFTTPEPELSVDDLSYSELRQQLKQRGLPSIGKKAHLLQQLRAALAQSDSVSG